MENSHAAHENNFHIQNIGIWSVVSCRWIDEVQEFLGNLVKHANDNKDVSGISNTA
jgi:hypothetical protein